jgi:hypothetical protein
MTDVVSGIAEASREFFDRGSNARDFGGFYVTTAGPNAALAADQTAPVHQSPLAPAAPPLPATRAPPVTQEAEVRRRASRLGLLLMAASGVAMLTMIAVVLLGIRWLL